MLGIGVFPDAIAIADKNLARFNGSWALHEVRADAKAAIRNDAEAFKDFAAAIALAHGSDLVGVLEHRGRLYNMREQFVQAIADFNQAIAIDGAN